MAETLRHVDVPSMQACRTTRGGTVPINSELEVSVGPSQESIISIVFLLLPFLLEHRASVKYFRFTSVS
jgi:hypothetical protein